jgi:hypothetical protein
MLVNVEFIFDSRHMITFLKSVKLTGDAVSKFLENEGLEKHS